MGHEVAVAIPDHLASLVAATQAQCDQGWWAQAQVGLETLYGLGHQPALTAQQLGDVCGNQGLLDEAIRWHKVAITHDPQRYRSYENLIFMLDARAETTQDEADAARQRWWQQFGKAAYAKRQPYTNLPIHNRRLRVGYISGDFNFHSAAMAWLPVVARHNLANIEPVLYCTLQPERYDKRTKLWNDDFGDHFVDVSGQPFHQLALTIQRDQVDILVDLAGYTNNNRLMTFAYAPAPIRVQAWGYVTGTNSQTMTHVFADPVACPPALRARMPEQVVDLPAVLSYHPRSKATGAPCDLPDPSPLPCFTGSPVFSVFQRAIKVTDPCVRVWRQILERLPEATIMFKAADYTPMHRTRIANGFGDCRSRITFDGHTDHHDHHLWYHSVDLALDPWPQTGGVSTLEGLWNGVPCVTLLGDRMIQRTSASFLTTLGLGDLIAHTEEEYIDKAVQYVTSARPRLGDWRQRLRTMLEKSPIVHGYVDAVEEAYRLMWREWCNTQRQVA